MVKLTDINVHTYEWCEMQSWKTLKNHTIQLCICLWCLPSFFQGYDSEKQNKNIKHFLTLKLKLTLHESHQHNANNRHTISDPQNINTEVILHAGTLHFGCMQCQFIVSFILEFYCYAAWHMEKSFSYIIKDFVPIFGVTCFVIFIL